MIFSLLIGILGLHKIDLMLPLLYFSKLHRIYYVGTDIHLKVLYIIWSVAVFVVVFFFFFFFLLFITYYQLVKFSDLYLL